MTYAEARRIEKQDFAAKELDDLIDEVEGLLEKVPPSLSEIWEKKFDDLIDSEMEDLSVWLKFKKDLINLSQRRAKAAEHLESDFYFDEIDRYKGLITPEAPFYEQEEEISSIRELVSNKQNKLIGAGQVAEVFVNLEDPSKCFKVVKDWQKYREGNNLLKEAYLQIMMSKFNDQLKARVPAVAYCAALKDFRVISMERVNGASLSELMLDTSRVPDNFDFDVFFGAVQEFVDKMHKTKIHHRDLHAGNVMVDYDSALPYIIDFGLAVETSFLTNEEDIYKIKNADGSVTRYNHDDLQLRQVKNKFKSALAKNI